jgi:ABC-type multidrug transport system fused ATPase/permease subunit
MQLIDALRGDNVEEEVRTVTLAFTYLGCVTLVAHFLETACFMWSGKLRSLMFSLSLSSRSALLPPDCHVGFASVLALVCILSNCVFSRLIQCSLAGARITSKLRQKYLRAALHQDIAHFDTELTSGDIVNGLNADCNAVQNAISDKVGATIHHMVTVFAALILALVRGWKLALVMIALLPLIAVAGGILAKLLTWGTTKQSEAYAKANGVSGQTILNMRTVQSFQAESTMLNKFVDLLALPRKIAIQLSLYTGMGTGFVNAIIFVTCVFSLLLLC